jgi:acyl-CoA dehydrogenase
VSPVLAGDEWTNVLERAALGRSLSMCGALQRTRDLTVHYATERVQFGRPLRVFQAVQHHLASIEGWVRGAKAACSAVVTHEEPFAVAATRWWTGRACREVARAAHQVHGAIGVTRELDLHRYTTRLLAWSTEYGNEHFWAVRVGELTGRGSDVEGAWRQ